MSQDSILYQSRQFLKLLWLFLPLFTIGMVLFDMREQSLSLLPRALLIVLLVNIVILSMFGYLQIQLDSQVLSWSFGLVAWPRWNLPITEIARVEVCETQWFEGKGIRFTREGMLYNAAGRGAVRIFKTDGSRFRLGSSEPEMLCAQIQKAMGQGRS